MDAKPDHHQYDKSEIEVEITDIDAEDIDASGHRASGSSKLEPLFTSLIRHARLWSALAIVTGCVVIAILLFPDVASFITPVTPSPTAITPGVHPYTFVTVTGNNNVTFVLGQLQIGMQSSPLIRNTSVTAYDTRTGTLLWRTPPHQSSRIMYGLATDLNSQGENIYALNVDGLVSLLAPRTGDILWSYKPPSDITKSLAIEQDDVFYFSDSEQAMYAVKDGRMLWRNTGLGTILAINDGIVYTYDDTQQRYDALDEESGSRLWSYKVPSSTQSLSTSSPSLAVANKICYVQTSDNKILAIQSQGHVLWSHQLNDPVMLKADAHRLYAVNQSTETLEILNLQTGQKERTPLPETGVMDIVDMQDNLLYIQTDEEVKAVNADTGKVTWQKALTGSRPLWAANGTLYASSSDSTTSLQAISERDGTVLWSGVIKSEIVSVDASVLDLLSPDEYTVSVLRLSDGKILWSKHIE